MNVEYYKPSLLNVFRFKGSIIPNVILQTLIITLFTAIITGVHITTNIKLSIPESLILIPVTGFSISLLLTYRLNSACNTYMESRKTWSGVVVCIRNITRLIWVDIRSANETDKKEEKEILIEKRAAIRLLVGFAFALKHFLRGEDGNILEDIKPYLSVRSHLPGFEILNQLEIITDNQTPKTLHFINKKKQPVQPFIDLKHNLPLEITLYISSYVTTQFRKKRIEVPMANVLLAMINEMVLYITRFERILKTPLPLAFSIHLYQTLWIYCLSLPFQFVAIVGWLTIVIVFFVAFILFGVERIAAEVENPFGDGYNHFDLDYFCETIKREVSDILKHEPPDDSHWVFDFESSSFTNDITQSKEDVNANNEIHE
ncbi:14614_t:CDS:2 [Dentiscutata erythropus]|uniref:14614_t:CDS:1 n=1 Tax=Dentiscutata erythropus TaxID=1348616 RepID=A0A9N9HQY4_9GLOM|nr:14614_t:CDS:2 [Dentiscutata erythropus]